MESNSSIPFVQSSSLKNVLLIQEILLRAYHSLSTVYKDKFLKCGVCHLIRKMTIKQCFMITWEGAAKGAETKEHVTLTEKGWKNPYGYSITGDES